MKNISRKKAIRYINSNHVRVRKPEYPGRYYPAIAPATLDLAERASLAVNALTEPLDPDYNDELYWIVDLIGAEPSMYHTMDDHVQAKFFESLPLVRIASGSKQNLVIEHRLMQTMLQMQGSDGLIYIPIRGRPWAVPPSPDAWTGFDFLPKGNHLCSLHMTGRVLGAFCIYAMKDPSGPWRKAVERLVQGIKRVCITEGDIAYLPWTQIEPDTLIAKPATKPIGMKAAFASWLAQGLAQCHRTLDNPDARDLALKLMRYIMRDTGYFADDGEFGYDCPGLNLSQPKPAHFHLHTNPILAALEVVQATGDPYLLDRALKGYTYAVSQGQSLVGFFPEYLTTNGGSGGSPGNTSELCEVADMIAAAVKLSLLGHDKWDDVDRWVRNQFAECQLTHTHWLTDGHVERMDRKKFPLPNAGAGPPQYGTTERVIERSVGAFAGWPSANDWIGTNRWSIQHCCTGNATRAIYYVWENILTYKAGKLRVNLLLNRASPWADLNSHIPFTGKVDAKIKRDLDLEIRIAEWVQPEANHLRRQRPPPQTDIRWTLRQGG
ncbi:MAG: hypothetical protein HY360_16485 [Verrucomicrobia bacterium]|nr:hypothetical protein [Verrucomicrobiota bacterium]